MRHPTAIDDVVFLGRAVERLSGMIADQTQTVFDRMGIVIPVRSCSLVAVLAAHGSASAADLARTLGHSHQLVMQKIPKLVRLGLISHRNDDHDARRRVFLLTEEGTKQFEMFEKCTALICAAYADLFTEVGDVRHCVDRATAALEQKPLGERIRASG